jgi:hypothetical protein
MRTAFTRGLTLVAALFLGAMAMPAQAQAPTQAGKESKGLSERYIRVVQGIAWSRMPAKMEEGNQTIELDKSDPKRFWLPDDDARRVIIASDRSATAKLCNLNEAEFANFVAMMNIEKAANKWTREQLHMIKWVYLAVMEIRTAARIEHERGRPMTQEEVAAVASNPDWSTRQDFKCPDELKATVDKQITEYVMAANAKLKKR